ncbi:hypothetical protein D3C71_2016230 [compost metagenome]
MHIAWNKGGTTEAQPFVLYDKGGRFFLLYEIDLEDGMYGRKSDDYGDADDL